MSSSHPPIRKRPRPGSINGINSLPWEPRDHRYVPVPCNDGVSGNTNDDCKDSSRGSTPSVQNLSLRERETPTTILQGSCFRRANSTRLRRRDGHGDRPKICSSSKALDRFYFSTVWVALPMLLLVLDMPLLVSAKLRFPSSFALGGSQNDADVAEDGTPLVVEKTNDVGNYHDVITDTNYESIFGQWFSSSAIPGGSYDDVTATIDPETFTRDTDGTTNKQDANGASDQDSETLFNHWLRQNWSTEPQESADSSDRHPPSKEAESEQGSRELRRRQRIRGGFEKIPLPFASTEQYLSLLEERMKTIRRVQAEFRRVATNALREGWKAGNDVVRYKFPVGIVTAWSVLKIVQKIGNRERKQNQKRGDSNGEDDDSDQRATEEDKTDSYKYILRHTGRALDLDSDDLTLYRHLGGIERVRSRLVCCVLEGELQTLQSRDRNSLEERSNTDRVRVMEQLLEALIEALSLEFIPGGSHSDYTRRMIPFVSRAEDCAHRLGILNTVHSAEELRPLVIALRTAEVRILDSQLRSIRDRLVRTTYRLHRTVQYWKTKVESTRLSSSLTATTITGLSARSALLPWTRLRRKWSRFFFFGAGSQDQNSLLEGERMRLAFVEAAYHSEIVRLGQVLKLLAKRPEEMPDSTLTTALVSQQQEQQFSAEYEQTSHAMERTLPAENENEDFEYDDDEDSDESVARSGDESTRVGQKKGSRHVASTLIAMRKQIAARFFRKRNMNEDDENHSDPNKPLIKKMVGAFSALFSSSFIQPVRGATVSMMKVLNETVKRKRHRSGGAKRFSRYFAIRFNADGRGRFSVQNFDEGSVTIESNTALDILLYRAEYDQRPWLEHADAWSLEARGLIVDTIRETVDASIVHGGGSNAKASSGSVTTNKESKNAELAKLESTWRLRHYEKGKYENVHSADALAEGKHELFPNLLSPASMTSSSGSVQQRQWMILYEISRDINRLRRVGEGKSLKFKWKEVHWIHWLMQWNLMGIPSAALKILVAFWVHDYVQPYGPKIKTVANEVYEAASEIFTTRFWTPLKDLVDEIMNRRKGLVTGVSLAEEEASLDIMLHDLGLGDGTPASRHEATIRATRQYESHMRSGLMWHALGGQLVRLMLIQMQQLKVSMLDAAETIDVLFQSNRINMQVLAVVPAVGIVFVGTKLLVRFLFSVRAKDLRPIASVHADMTNYLNKLEKNIILRKNDARDHFIHSRDNPGTNNKVGQQRAGNDATVNLQNSPLIEEKQLGEFALTLYNYLLLLDYSSPQPLPSRQCDDIHQSLTEFLGRKGSFQQDNLSTSDQIRLIDLVKGRHQDLSKFL